MAANTSRKRLSMAAKPKKRITRSNAAPDPEACLDIAFRTKRSLQGRIGQIEHENRHQPDRAPGLVKKDLEELSVIWSDLHRLNTDILQVIDDEDFNDYQFEYNNILSGLKIIQVNLEESISPTLVLDATGTSDTGHSQPKASVRLPKLELPTFNADLNYWPAFKDLFTATIHNNSTLSDAQKLQYLKASLIGEAAHLLRSVQVSDANYADAWEAVIQRYHNKREIVTAIIHKLCSQPVCQVEDGITLRKLVDTTNECVRALSALDIPVDGWDAILVYLVTQKLESEARRDWELRQKTDAVPTFRAFIEFIEQRARALNALSLQGKERFKRNVTSPKLHPSSNQRQVSVNTGTVEIKKAPCQQCKGRHGIFKCNSFRLLSNEEKTDTVRKHDLCSNCLSSNHKLQACKAGGCRSCGARHHTLLHPDRQTRDKTETQESVTVSTLFTKNRQVSSQVLLATALLEVVDIWGKTQVCRALLDSGAQVSFISEACVHRLGAQRSHVRMSVTGIGATPNTLIRNSAQIKVTSMINPTFSLDIEVFVIPRITGDLPAIQLDIKKWNHVNTLKLADPTFYQPHQIDLLLGADVFMDIVLGNRRTGPPGAPVALETEFGWILSGRIDQPSELPIKAFHIRQLDPEIERFWDLEDASSGSALTEEENVCEKHFLSTHKRTASGRFIVQLPVKPNITVQGASRNQAIRRLKGAERRHSDPDELQEYNAFLSEYLKLGHMEPVPPDEVQSPTALYLPHHAVRKESSISTKLRVVFDGSAKSTTGVSLNDCLIVGPTVQDSLIGILLRFRTHAVAFSADIAKMYRQILIDDSHVDLQRIVWRPAPGQPICDFRLRTVTYGTSSAPFLATRCLKQLSVDEAERFPRASQVVQNDFYVDDVLSGAEDVSSALQLQADLIALTQRGGFELRQWASNKTALLQSLPSGYNVLHGPLQIHPDATVRTLGLYWHPATDHFSFTITPSKHRATETKRSFLSEIAKIYDPLGWLAPLTVKLKIAFQNLWTTSCGWDDHLPEETSNVWASVCSQLSALTDIRIPRQILDPVTIRCELHGFCDASTRAYAAVAYLRSISPSGPVRIALITAKTRVAPLKTVTLPRLELCAAVLLATLLKAVITALNIHFDAIYAWSDSTVTLAWIAGSPAKWNTFVSNRVARIQLLIPTAQWHHVSGSDNPADCASRGVVPSELPQHPLWWKGPDWLADVNYRFETTIAEHDKDATREAKHAVVLTIEKPPFALLTRYSSWSKLLRVTAYLYRFCHNCRVSSSAILTSVKRTGPFSQEERTTAETCWIKQAQLHAFGSEIRCLTAGLSLSANSNIQSLAPFLDHEMILRVGGRLHHAELPTNQKHPILLPHNHKVTEMIVAQEHLRNLHGGPQLLLATLQQRFWIPRGRDVIRRHVRGCVICCRHRAATCKQLMGQLPASRVNPSRPFSKCGVDYAGPFDLKVLKGRGRASFKGFVALFICFTTRAIHLELVSALSSVAFIAALRRFIARRGRPSDIFSDCGTNFVGANKELKLFLKLAASSTHNDLVSTELSESGISWHFNPPSAPHFGGLWEAGVKSMKFHLKRVVGNTSLNFEELTTLLTQIEACLNSRPLCPLSSEPSDLDPLTPGHFLIGAPLLAVPEPDSTAIKINRLSRWQLVQQIVQHFWKRWSREYLSRLQQRPKWWIPKHNIKLHDLVLLKEDNLPPLSWKLGRIMELFPGTDGLTRVVNVKTAAGLFKRPVTKLCPLPFNTNDSD